MQKRLKWLFFGFLLLLVLPLLGSNAVAVTTPSSSNSFQKQLTGDSRKLATTAALPTKATRASEFAQTACETHVKVIKIRQGNIITFAERAGNRLNKLTLAVEKYYTDTLVPQGKIVPNYDSLVSDVSSKQAALTPLIEKLKADSDGLTCDKNQAKSQFATFRNDMQSFLKAFKNYHLSVLKLMQAVKRVAGDSEGGEASSSAQEN